MNRSELIKNNLKMIESDDEEFCHLFINTFYPSELTVKLKFNIDKFKIEDYDDDDFYTYSYNSYISLEVLDLETEIILYTDLFYLSTISDFYQVENLLLYKFFRKFNIKTNKFMEFLDDYEIYEEVFVDFYYKEDNVDGNTEYISKFSNLKTYD